MIELIGKVVDKQDRILRIGIPSVAQILREPHHSVLRTDILLLNILHVNPAEHFLLHLALVFFYTDGIHLAVFTVPDKHLALFVAQEVGNFRFNHADHLFDSFFA